MADVKKPVDLEGLGVMVQKFEENYVKKGDVPVMNFATREEILALFEDKGGTAGGE